MYNYFAHDPEAGTEFFRTEEEAIAYCNDAIQDCREQAMEDCEWQELVENVCWGVIEQITNEVNYDPESGSCDYELVNV